MAITLLILSACDSALLQKSGQSQQVVNEVAQTNLDLGIAYLKERNYEKALNKLNKARKAAPTYSSIYNVYGLLYQQLNDPDKAEQYFKRAMSLNRHDSSALNNYGRFLCDQNRIGAAEKIFIKAAENPFYDTPEIAIANAGLCLDNHDQQEKALHYYERALAINPNIPPILLRLVEAGLNKDDYVSAKVYLKRYQNIASHTPKSLWLGIQIDKHLGNLDSVSSYALLLRNMFPNAPETQLLNEFNIR